MSQIIPFPSQQKRNHPWIRSRDHVFSLIWAGLKGYRHKSVRGSVWLIARRIVDQLGADYSETELMEACEKGREDLMAALDGRPARPKAQFIAEEAALKAARKGEANQRTKQKIKHTAERATKGTINVEWYVKFAESNGLDGAKVRAFCEAKLKYPVSREEFNQWLNEALSKGRFNP